VTLLCFSRARLAVIPGITHFMPPGRGMLDHADMLLAMIPTLRQEVRPDSLW